MLADQMDFWEKHQRYYERIFTILDDLSIDYTISYRCLECTLKSGAKDFLSFHSKITSAGWETQTELPNEPVNHLGVTYFYPIENEKLRLYVFWSNTFCKMVKIGTKLEEKPVYKIECTEDRTPWDEESE